MGECNGKGIRICIFSLGHKISFICSENGSGIKQESTLKVSLILIFSLVELGFSFFFGKTESTAERVFWQGLNNYNPFKNGKFKNIVQK